MMFAAHLPLPPSANVLFTEYRGRRIITRPYKAWRAIAGPLVLQQWHAAGRPMIGKPYQVHIRINANHLSDIANREKAITDLLVATIPGFPDDAWIDRYLIERDQSLFHGAQLVAADFGEVW